VKYWSLDFWSKVLGYAFILLISVTFLATGRLAAQGAAHTESANPALSLSPQEKADIAADVQRHNGDSPANAGPQANDLSPSLDPADVMRAMRLVANWQLDRSRQFFNLEWPHCALYTGFITASDALHDPKYRAAVYLAARDKFKFTTGDRKLNADDQCMAQIYLDLYLHRPEPMEITAVKAQFDTVMQVPDNPTQIPWWWCDALFMAPPAWVRLTKATGDRRYLDYMDREWHETTELLWDPQEHFYFRDATYFQKREKNGRKIFWSRGEGWVMAGTARVLDVMPEDYPGRNYYVQHFQQMAAALLPIQQPDGLWRSGLLDPDAYPLPENSGSAFFTYALAWGINHHLLEEKIYRPVVAKAWAGLISHIYQDGRLGSMQQVGADPAHFTLTSSYIYGVGGFLLAGSEIEKLPPVQ
jgi:rhamnogalacturonyl hydrolase YesR